MLLYSMIGIVIAGIINYLMPSYIKENSINIPKEEQVLVVVLTFLFWLPLTVIVIYEILNNRQ